MLSITPLTDDSYPVAIIKQTTGKKAVLETVYYTEPSKTFRKQKEPFHKQIEPFLSKEKPGLEGAILLDSDKYAFEMVPTIGGDKNPRFINYYLSASNSGKSFQIASLCMRYLQQFPNHLIAYASANPLENDSNYDSIRDKIKEVNVLGLESTIDFKDEAFHNSLWIFDDCDSGFSVSMEDLDKRLTPEEIEKLTVTDKVKATKMLKAKCEAASEWVSKSIQSFMMNGRKFSESLCIVSHKPFEGRFENKIVNEATGIVLFPASVKKNLLTRFITEKLSFDKKDATSMILDLEWFQYDFLFISHRTSRPFILTSELIKVYD